MQAQQELPRSVIRGVWLVRRRFCSQGARSGHAAPPSLATTVCTSTPRAAAMTVAPPNPSVSSSGCAATTTKPGPSSSRSGGRESRHGSHSSAAVCRRRRLAHRPAGGRCWPHRVSSGHQGAQCGKVLLGVTLPDVHGQIGDVAGIGGIERQRCGAECAGSATDDFLDRPFHHCPQPPGRDLRIIARCGIDVFGGAGEQGLRPASAASTAPR